MKIINTFRVIPSLEEMVQHPDYGNLLYGKNGKCRIPVLDTVLAAITVEVIERIRPLNIPNSRRCASLTFGCMTALPNTKVQIARTGCV